MEEGTTRGPYLPSPPLSSSHLDTMWEQGPEAGGMAEGREGDSLQNIKSRWKKVVLLLLLDVGRQGCMCVVVVR